MTISVAKLMDILDAYDPQSFVKVFDPEFKELSHIDKVFDKPSQDGMDVILQIKES